MRLWEYAPWMVRLMARRLPTLCLLFYPIPLWSLTPRPQHWSLSMLITSLSLPTFLQTERLYSSSGKCNSSKGMWKGITRARYFWSWRQVSWSSSEEFTYPIEWEAGWGQEVNRTCWRKPLALLGIMSWSCMPQPLAFLTGLSWLACNTKAI
jgi:hypothetical protein